MSIIHYIRQKWLDAGNRFVGWIQTLDGFVFSIDTAKNDLDRVLYKHRRAEVQLTDLMRRTLRKGDIFVDVGANRGYYTLLALRLGCKVIAIEPVRSHIKAINLNATINGFKNYVVHDIIASSKDGVLPFKIVEENSGLSHVSDDGNYTTCRKLSSILPKKVRFIKIDVEGHEQQVLKGLNNVSADYVYIDGFNREN